MSTPSSPSERYAAFKRGQETPAFTEFARLYDFPLDDFQVRACHERQLGHLSEEQLRQLIALLQAARTPHEDTSSHWRPTL